jgi:hypothetical protein
MNESQQKQVINEEAACERCGRFGAFQIGTTFLCQDCYVESGSCCPEFGADAESGEEREQTKPDRKS